MSIENSTSEPAAADIVSELSRVLASDEFAVSGHLSRFLKFVVDETLAGREQRLKERTIALKALGRDTDFDPRLDPIVRVVAGKLRRALDRYYANDGANDPLRITVPKGAYRPVFTRVDSAPAARSNATDERPAGPQNEKCLTALPVVAVVPFLTLTPGAEERFIADSIAEDVCVRLSRFRWFEVVDCLKVWPRRDARQGPIPVASQVGADFCLTGTLRKQGPAMRATVQLAETAGGTLIWGDQFDMRVNNDDVCAYDAIVSRIAATVGDIFGVLATAVWNRSRRKPLEELTACEAVLTNLKYQSSLADRMYAAAVGAALRAVKANPDFAWGWAALAMAHLDAYAGIAGNGVRNASEESLDCVRRALGVDPTCALAHWTLGLYHMMHGHCDEALRAVEQTVEFANGSSFEIAAAGAVISAVGEHQRGQLLIDQALAINPRLPGWVHWATAINDFNRSDLHPVLLTTQKFSLPECFWDHLFRGAAFDALGEKELAKASLRRACRLRPSLAKKPSEFITKVVQEPELQERLVGDLRAVRVA